MNGSRIADLQSIATPAIVADLGLLKRNMEKAAEIRRRAGCKILLATKAFALPAAFPLMREYLDGTTASGLFEARLGHSEFGKEVHTYAPAYAANEIDELLGYTDHIYFNSPQQTASFAPQAKAKNKKIGLRVNPGYSHVTLGDDLYNPCAPCSRFGTLPEQFDQIDWSQIDIFHTHVLCESLHEGSAGLIAHVAKNFGKYLGHVKAVNFGGGHFINKTGYDIDVLIKAITDFRAQFPHLEVILEPGAGLVYGAGFLVSSVLDVHHNTKDIAILDTSASTHMPDVLEVPYRPEVIGAGPENTKAHSYILAGKTCMTGDVIGEYSFDAPLETGSKLVFEDMLQYSFVKSNTFNGMPLPDLYLRHTDGRMEQISQFGYDDFRIRLGKHAK